nr:GHKL domain-containing protein [Tissierella sp.]
MNSRTILWLAISIIISITLIIILLKYIFNRMIDKRIDNYQSALISKQYTEVENIYKEMRGWKHDYHNHIQVMKAYLDLNKYEDMVEYLDELDADLREIDKVIKTGNLMVDAILNSKLSLALSKSIDINVKATVPKDIKVADIDLCIIIGNLMDNAMENTLKLQEEDRFIRVYIREMKEQLYISITNSYGGEVKKSGLEYLTTKLGKNHGFGLKRVDSIVNKYDGFLNRQREEGVFATEIILPL